MSFRVEAPTKEIAIDLLFKYIAESKKTDWADRLESGGGKLDDGSGNYGYSAHVWPIQLTQLERIQALEEAIQRLSNPQAPSAGE